MNELELIFVNPISVAGLSIVLVEAIKQFVKLSDRQKQLISWLVATALCLVGHAYNLGMFQDMPYPLLVLTILLTGPASNGMYSYIKPKDQDEITH